VTNLTEEKDSLIQEGDELKEKIAKFEEDIAQAQTDVKNGKMALAETFDGGFEHAKVQTIHFHPTLDLSGLDPYKILVNDELVDEE